MSKLQRSWELFKCALIVVNSNRKLLVFPIITSMLTLVIVLFFIVPLAFWSTGHGFLEAEHWKILASQVATWNEDFNNDPNVRINVVGYAALAAIYMLSVFMATFFNVAFFNEILHALNGQPVSIRGGLRFAVSRLKAIIAWTLLTGIVGLLIKFLEERVGFVGRWIVRLIGIAWSVAAVFAIPVIVREEKNANPFEFLKTSALLLKRTWGESLVGYVGMQLSSWLILGGSIVYFIAFVGISYALGSAVLIAVSFAVWFVLVFVFAYLANVLSQVYRAALYIYATEGVVPGPFDEEQMNMAWKVQSGRKGEIG